MNKRIGLLAALIVVAAVLAAPEAGAKMSILNSKHDLSATSTGAAIKALTEGRVCVFCHTPHNAAPATPLWNKKLDAIFYDVYASSTLKSAPWQPTGATRLCLSCHDGTVALGEVLQPSQTISMTVAGGMPATSRSYLGTDLRDDHPVSFSYYSALPNPELAISPPAGLIFYADSSASGIMQCTTCHDAHDNTNKKFLAVDNTNSTLCTTCHQMSGWTPFASHSTSTGIWNGSGANPWPRTGTGTDFNFDNVTKNGCENCHTPHSAGGPKRLMNYLNEEDNCYPCHNGNVAARNVYAEFQKTSLHNVAATTAVHDPTESPYQITGHVECQDCHNPHASNNASAAAPAVSGALAEMSGVDINNATLVPPGSYAANEYEICFKCHASNSAQSGMTAGYPIPRVLSSVNMRTNFQTSNPSTHFVAGLGGYTPNVPSQPFTNTANETWSITSKMYCTDCHDADDSRSLGSGNTGPRGPHGSSNAPILKKPYSIADPTPYSSSAYGLCYWCHNETSILSDASFAKNSLNYGGHSGHLMSTGPTNTVVDAPCADCHDAHGIYDPAGATQSHTHLINFNTNIVSALTASGYSSPLYFDTGVVGTRTCALICHGVTHDGSPTFSY